jgi:hypothetical protein
MTKPKTGKPVEIRVPTRGEFENLVRKVARSRSGRKRPAETDRPPEQSG